MHVLRATNQQRRLTRTLIVLVTIASVAACQTAKLYEDPDLPVEEIAIVSTAGFFHGLGNEFYLFQVDRILLGDRTSTAQVPPGVHSFGVKYVAWLGQHTSYITFHAKAGHHYQIEADFHQGLRIWAIDTANDEVVAGKKPLNQ